MTAPAEFTGARIRSLFGGGARLEAAAENGRTLSEADVASIAGRIIAETTLEEPAANAIAEDIVARARGALRKLAENPAVALADAETMALESVMQVRGRPALRVFDDCLDSLEKHPGSELWMEYVAVYEDIITTAAAGTGAVVVSAFASGLPPWTQGSAWLSAQDRVVTNRHVLAPSTGERLVEPRAGGGGVQLRTGYRLAVEFAADHRAPEVSRRRRVTDVLYMAPEGDPVDIAVLKIEPLDEQGCPPLMLAAKAAQLPTNLFIVGHPAPLADVPAEVATVFGTLDSRKRVSFGKRLGAAARASDFVHDASTVGGYSGGPVLGIHAGTVSGLHYFGDPLSGNLAVTVDAIRAHPAYPHMKPATP